MGKFNLEDYRHPWETGPHWELKKEFMEKYSDMFPEDRLLCLAQAYSNIVLMNCSYPDPVMRQISLLSQPLKMRKRFQESNTSEGSQQQKGKRKCNCEKPEKSSKFIKFCPSKDNLISTFESESSKVLPENLLNMPSCEIVDCSNVSSGDNLVNTSQPFKSNSYEDNVSHNQISALNSDVHDEKTVKSKTIVSSLGVEFIKNFIEEIRKFQAKALSAGESIFSAAQKLKISNNVNFKIESVPNCPPHAPLFYSELIINDCIIASEQDTSKKKAKAKCAESALNMLISCQTFFKTFGENKLQSKKVEPVVNNLSDKDLNSTVKCIHEKSMNIQQSQSNPNVMCTNEIKNQDSIVIMKILQTFSESITRSNCESIEQLLSVARSLNFHNYIAFNTSIQSDSQQEYICKFFFKNILISSENHINIKIARELAVKTGLQKLKKLPHYEIIDGELSQRENTDIDKLSNLVSSNSMCKKNFQSSSFILNQRMFDSSMRDGFVLINDLSKHPESQRNSRIIISSSAGFCHTPFEYQFEEIPETGVKASLIIGGEVCGTGIALAKIQAKIIAADNAVETLKKKYYTLKVKSEYSDGYIINRNQVFEGESFSSNTITESNIGCKMLKMMGWTGGGLGASGISEPIEAQGHSSFGRGLGYKQGNADLQLFKKRINSMLLDYSKTNTLSGLVFSKDFTKEERKEIHQIAQKYNLHTASQGKKDDRFLTVRHKYTATQVLLHLAKNGGSDTKFELVDATNVAFETNL